MRSLRRRLRIAGPPGKVALALIALMSLSGGPTNVGLSGTGYTSRMITRRPPGPGRFALELDAAGHRWSYQVHVPPCYDGQTPLPLVLVLHGSGLSGVSYLDQAHWASVAELRGFLVAAPDALAARPGYETSFWLNPRQWNSGQHDPSKPRTQVDDLLFFRALLDDLESRWPVDRDRVYVAGHSNGGAMAFRLATEMPDRFAAAASVAGLSYVQETPSAHPRPILFIGGTADPVLPVEGGKSTLPWETRTTPPVLENLADHATRVLGCDPSDVETELGDGLVIRRYKSGARGPILTAVLIEGHGHGWPGADRFGPDGLLGPETRRFDATRYICDFFASQSRADD